MKVLVTGGAGFIGSHLVKRLLRMDAEVTVLDTFFTGHPDNLGEAYGGPNLQVIQGSVTNWDAVRRAMSGAFIVYHLAARMDWSEKPRHAAIIAQTNIMGTVWVLTMARAMGVPRVIFTSSAAVYGDVYPGFEDGPCRPISVYGASKLAAEVFCRGFTALGSEVVVLRWFNVHGLGGHGVVDVFKDGGGVVYGDGGQTRDFVHVSDVVNALIAAQDWAPGTYNVGTGVETTIMGLWHLIRNEDEPTFESARREIWRSYADREKVGHLWCPWKELVK